MAVASDPAIVTVAPYVVALVSVAGSTAAIWITRRDSHSAWLRDNRLVAYTSLLHGMSRAFDRAVRVMQAGGQGTPAGAERDIPLVEALLEIDVARDTIGVLGPEAAYEAANDYVSAMLNLVHIARSGARIPPEAEDEIARTSSAFVRATRTTLAGRSR